MLQHDRKELGMHILLEVMQLPPLCYHVASAHGVCTHEDALYTAYALAHDCSGSYAEGGVSGNITITPSTLFPNRSMYLPPVPRRDFDGSGMTSVIAGSSVWVRFLRTSPLCTCPYFKHFYPAC